MTKITLDIWGLTFMEPMALIIDWILAVQAFIYYKRLKSEASWGFVRLWKAHFLTFSVSVFFGGLAHFLFFYTGKYGNAPGWTFALISITFLELAISTTISSKWGRRLHYLIAFKFITLMALMSFDFVFKWVVIQSVTGLLFVLGGVSIYGIVQGKKHMKYFLLGVIVMICSIPFMVFGIDPHLWFNRHDVSHTLMIITLLLLYKGVKKSV